jgi:1,4-dihydroxy-2-naphthoate polyprenyltransferase
MASLVTETQNISKAQAWLIASRPKTLPAALVPVVVASALAYAHDSFVLLPALAALVCSLLIQVGTNLANDYFDYVKGSDREDRKGPTRVVQSGIIKPEIVRMAMVLVFALAFMLGLYLVYVAGWPILLIGIASIIFAVLYTAGPFPLAYIGLGDVFVFIFFGIVAVMGTYYVQALEWSVAAFIASLPVGALATAILVVNNYRDVDEDRISGKKTLAVRFGRKSALWMYRLLLLMAYMVPAVHIIEEGFNAWLLLPIASLPLALKNLLIMERRTDGPSLNNALAGTAMVLLLFGVLYSLGFLLS